MKIPTYILLFFSALAFMLSGYKLYIAITHPLRFTEDIIFYANEYNIKPEIIASIINIESSFYTNAKSNKNAIGLMQIKLTTANYLNNLNGENLIEEKDLFNPNTNIKYGTSYLNYLIQKFKDLNTSLASYNAGETRVLSWLKDTNYSEDGITLNYIPYLETRNYIKNFNKNMKFYSKMF